MPDWKDCWLLFAFAGMTCAWGTELPVGMVSERWRAPSEGTTVSPRLTQTSTASGSMVEWADEVATFGSGLAVVNGRGNDWRPWLVVGARALRLEGLRLGGVLGLRHDTEAWSVDFKVAGGLGDSFFGDDLTVVQDVNGDGFDELLVGAPGYESEGKPLGRVQVFPGGKDGLNLEAAWSMAGESPTSWFGAGAAPAGEVNGDGLADFLVSAPGPSIKFARALDWPGRVYCFAGGPEGPDTAPRSMVEGLTYRDWFGRSFAVVGDMDGDGEVELAVGLPRAGETLTIGQIDGPARSEGETMAGLVGSHGFPPANSGGNELVGATART